MIIVPLVLAYLIVNVWTFRILKTLLDKVLKRYPVLAKYLATIVPLLFVLISALIVFLLQLMFMLYIYILAIPFKAQILFKLLYFDSSALNPFQTLKWVALGIVLALIFGAVILLNVKKLTCEKSKGIMTMFIIPLTLFQATAHIWSNATDID
eukprot:gene19600-26283_t